MRSMLLIGWLLLQPIAMTAASRNLIVVNGAGETADWIDLTDSSITLGVDVLGLIPNEFLAADSIGVAINSGSSDLYIYSLPAMVRIDSVYLGANRNPWSGAWLNDSMLLVTNWLTSTVSKVNSRRGTLVGEHAIGLPAANINHPQGVVIVGRKAYITMSCFDDEYVYFPGRVEVYDLDYDSTVNRIAVGLNPQGIRLGPDGSLYVVCTGNYWDVFGMLYKIDTQTDAVIDSLEIGGQPGNIDINRSGIAFLAAGGWGPWGKVDDGAMPRYLIAGGARLNRSQDGGYLYTVDLNQWAVVRGPQNPILTDFGVVAVRVVSDSSVATCNFQDDTVTELDSAGRILARYHTGDGPTAAAKYPTCFVPAGDADGSGLINVSDAVFLIAYIFADGPAPVNDAAADADGNGILNISDAVFLIGYIFGDGPQPQGCAD